VRLTLRPIVDRLRRTPRPEPKSQPHQESQSRPIPTPEARPAPAPDHLPDAKVDNEERGSQKPAWRRALEALISRVTGNRFVMAVLALVNTANEAGVTLFAAALAFSTMFALVPLVLLLSGVLGWLVDDPAQRSALLAQLVGILPPFAEVFEASLESVVRQRGALSLVGLIGLVWGASNFYGSLDEVMRRLFPGGGVRNELSRRVRGMATIFILVTLIVGTISLSGIWALLDELVGGLAVWRYVGPGIALAIMVVVVFAVYRLVPTLPPGWREALLPAVVAGIAIGLLTNLFSLLAPLLIGGLSGFGVIATLFGALVWLNFSYQIMLYGAVWARLRRDQASVAR